MLLKIFIKSIKKSLTLNCPTGPKPVQIAKSGFIEIAHRATYIEWLWGQWSMSKGGDIKYD